MRFSGSVSLVAKWALIILSQHYWGNGDLEDKMYSDGSNGKSWEIYMKIGIKSEGCVHEDSHFLLNKLSTTRKLLPTGSLRCMNYILLPISTAYFQYFILTQSQRILEFTMRISHSNLLTVKFWQQDSQNTFEEREDKRRIESVANRRKQLRYRCVRLHLNKGW